MALHHFSKGFGSVVGSYIPITFGDKVVSVTVGLSLFKALNNMGRCVTACFWPDDVNFDRSKLNVGSSYANYAKAVTSSGSATTFSVTTNNNKFIYVNTNTIPDEKIEQITFTFNSSEIRANRIFFALLSTADTRLPDDYEDFYKGGLSIDCNTNGELYYREGDVTEIGNMIEADDPFAGSIKTNISVIHQGDENENESEITNNEKMIYCSDISYRTWSEPKGTFICNDSNFGDNAKYRISYIDGGESYKELIKSDDTMYTENDLISINEYNGYETIKPYIRNKKNNFNSDYHIPEGRLRDVKFAKPECPEYYKAGKTTNTYLPEPRWVFKRSRIMFTIPPAKRNGKIETRDVWLRYKVVTTIFNNSNNEYDGDWKECKYPENNNGEDIKLVICPRDEGILDNMAFRVIFSRSVGNANNYSSDTSYYFHTYQRPIVNIAYPKIIRNESTNLNNGRGFKYAKILTSNMYSNFDDEEAIVNKYVCDALNVILATPRSDDSGIPQFVRFHLAEHKYGRTGLLKTKTIDGKEVTLPEWGEGEDTVQSLYRSNNESDYAKLDNILNNDNEYKTAFMTGVCMNDGQPLLFSGRFTNKMLSEVGQNYKLWTYRTWDNVDLNKDVLVGNAWPIKSTEHYNDENDTSTYGLEKRYNKSELINPSNSKEYAAGEPKQVLLTKPVVHDHIDMSIVPDDGRWPDGKPKYVKQDTVSTAILFRAGYIYLLRVRMFHGAAAGAIGAKYGLINSVIYGGESGSGSYDYSDNGDYGGAYPYFPNHSDKDLILDDVAQYGELKPFTQKSKNANGDIVYNNTWTGPEDGTSGESLKSNKLNQTFPGFSEVDYSIIEPVCPYTSKSNLVTVHPTSPEIGANQWITFSYRHLAKSIGGIDTYNADGSKSNVFAKKAGGCQNTISRIMSIYTTCVETILTRYRTLSRSGSVGKSNDFYGTGHTGDYNHPNPSVSTEIISIWLEPITDRLSTTNDGYRYYESTDKRRKWCGIDNEVDAKDSKYSDVVCNTPQVYKFNAADIENLNNADIYCHNTYPFYKLENGEIKTDRRSESGLYAFNKYRQGITEANKDTYEYDYGDKDNKHEPDGWAENQIIWRTSIEKGTASLYKRLIEPMGNSYRWQPVINAMQSNIKEIQIEDVNNEDAKNYAFDENSYKYLEENNDYIDKNIQKMQGSVKKTNTFGHIENDSNDVIDVVHYRNEAKSYDLQTKYAFIDESKYEYKDKTNSSNTKDKRFTINEFAGYTNGDPYAYNDKPKRDNIGLAGYSVMYTTISRTIDREYNEKGNFKYFVIKSSETDTNTKNYGELFKRVPVSQDCENGKVTAFNGTNYVEDLSNIGNLSSSKTEYDINTKNNAPNNDNKNNASPIVRTTHYLYFKTWINTTFYMQVEATVSNYSCGGYDTDEDGNKIHLEDSYKDTRYGVFMFDGKKMNTIWSILKSYATHTRTLDNGHEEIHVDTFEDVIAYLSDSEDKSKGWLNDERQNKYGSNRPLNKRDKLIINPPTECRIKFGNELGLTEVYAEDNYGWGRCLSADDITSKQIKYNGEIGEQTPSGGIEVPVLVRYTPLLQPVLISEKCHDINTNNDIICETGNKNITVYKNSHKYVNVNTAEKNKKIRAHTFEFANGNANSNHSETILTDKLTLNIGYPFIAENNAYDTKSPNGGLDNVYYGDYHFDTDSFPANSPEGITNSLEFKNMDFLGGYGICTAYTILLVPSDPDIDEAKNKGIINDFERNHYFGGSAGHWNYYKQYANYYKDGSIFNIRSKSQSTQGPVLVAYNVQPKNTNTTDYTKDGVNCPNDWLNNSTKSIKGRNFQSIDFDINRLIAGQVYYKDRYVDFDEFSNETFINLDDKANILKAGLIYDLVIVPIYSNATVNTHDYIDGAGTINGLAYGGGQSDRGKDVHLAGSNPLILFNYLQYSLYNDPGYAPTPTPEPDDPDEPNPYRIWDSDCAIIYPNVDNSKFNIKSGDIKECPGFWLNNTFKLIVRMPSFRTKYTTYSNTDNGTIEIASNGMLDTDKGHTPNDFLFDDIQIHIGKIEELAEYGYPDTQHLNLNKITSKEELAKAHIISYKDYAYSGVFSKKLSNNAATSEEDNRELLTAGSLDPFNPNYKNRFIEINLSNVQIADKNGRMVPIYTLYPEGFYIQVRYKTAYASGTDVTQWSAWYGGSCDGGKTWWGDKGLGYYVPIRNYTDIHTDFRNYVKDSYPGANVKLGKGSFMTFGDTDPLSKNNPKDAKANPYYHIGTGNQRTTLTSEYLDDTQLVPDNYGINVVETLQSEPMTTLLGKTIDLSVNHDNPYENEILYAVTHDTEFSIPKNTSNLHQHMWEMLYIDYIVRNMCKLYYKPNNYNKIDKFNDNLIYHLSALYIDNSPLILNEKTCLWDDTEYHLFNTSETIKQYKGGENEVSISENKSDANTHINGDRYLGPNTLNNSIKGIDNIENRNRWNRNKYYRKIITKNDFDELNSHLVELVEFIRHPYLTGSNEYNINDPVFGVKYVLPCAPSELAYNRSRKMLIGHTVDSSPGLTVNNNINHTMMNSNYLKNTWMNIMTICRPGSLIPVNDTKEFTPNISNDSIN